MSSLVVGLVSIGVSIPATFIQFQSTLLAQNNNRLRVVEIGRLSTGERILQVPKELMQQRAYKEALKSPIRPRPDGKTKGYGVYELFLSDGKRLTFIGYDIASILEFKVGTQKYWATLCAYNGYACSGVRVSKPYFVDEKSVKGIGELKTDAIKMWKDNTKEGFFYIQTNNGSGTVSTLLVNLNLTIADPNLNAVLCEVSRIQYPLRGAPSPRIDNPNCQTGQQVTAK